MDQDSEQPDDEHSALGKTLRFKNLYLEVSIIFTIILCAIGGGMRGFAFFLFPLSIVVVRYPVLYIISVALLFISSIIGILKSDQNDNAKLFYWSAFLFCISIIAGILYFILPAVFWLATMD